MTLPSIHQFAEKVVLVNDVSLPVGRAVAIQLALNGAYVVGVSPAADGSADRLATELAELGTLARSMQADVWTEDGARAAAAEVEAAFGRLDILVNCLKYEPESSFFDISESAVAETLIRNIGPAIFLTRAVLDLMNSRPRPRIVNVGVSTADPVSEAAQAAIKSLTRELSRMLPDNFRVNGVEFVEQATHSDDGKAKPPRKPTESDDVARAVLFLLSSESKAVNGNILNLG